MIQPTLTLHVKGFDLGSGDCEIPIAANLTFIINKNTVSLIIDNKVCYIIDKQIATKVLELIQDYSTEK